MPDSTQLLPPAAQWAIVSGFFMPLIIACIQQPHWNKEFKAAIGFMTCVAATAIQLGIEQKLDAQNFFPTVLLVLTISVSTFGHFWKPLGIADAVRKIHLAGFIILNQEVIYDSTFRI